MKSPIKVVPASSMPFVASLIQNMFDAALKGGKFPTERVNFETHYKPNQMIDGLHLIVDRAVSTFEEEVYSRAI